MMQMHFFFSDKVVLLFDFWNVHSPAGMVLSVLVVLLVAALYEAIKIGKAKLLRQTIRAIPATLSQESLGEPDIGSVNSNLGQQNTTPKSWKELFMDPKAPYLKHDVQLKKESIFGSYRDEAVTIAGAKVENSTKWFLYHISQTLLHVAQVVIGYMVMLVVMSYNTWIFLGVIVGSALGYYVAYPVFTAR